MNRSPLYRWSYDGPARLYVVAVVSRLTGAWVETFCTTPSRDLAVRLCRSLNLAAC